MRSIAQVFAKESNPSSDLGDGITSESACRAGPPAGLVEARSPLLECQRQRVGMLVTVTHVVPYFQYPEVNETGRTLVQRQGATLANQASKYVKP